MEYTQLLDKAFKSVQKCEECERFEIKKAAGHFEGNKTVISNFSQIAACLRRKPEHIEKFLLKELATQGAIERDRLIIYRKIPSQLVNEKIEKYTKMFVICKTCGKPDTELIEENSQKFMRCLACGSKNPVTNKI